MPLSRGSLGDGVTAKIHVSRTAHQLNRLTAYAFREVKCDLEDLEGWYGAPVEGSQAKEPYALPTENWYEQTLRNFMGATDDTRFDLNSGHNGRDPRQCAFKHRKDVFSEVDANPDQELRSHGTTFHRAPTTGEDYLTIVTIITLPGDNDLVSPSVGEGSQAESVASGTQPTIGGPAPIAQMLPPSTQASAPLVDPEHVSGHLRDPAHLDGNSALDALFPELRQPLSPRRPHAMAGQSSDLVFTESPSPYQAIEDSLANQSLRLDVAWSLRTPEGRTRFNTLPYGDRATKDINVNGNRHWADVPSLNAFEGTLPRILDPEERIPEVSAAIAESLVGDQKSYSGIGESSATQVHLRGQVYLDILSRPSQIDQSRASSMRIGGDAHENR